MGVRNYANNKTTIFNPATNTVGSGVAMHYPRCTRQSSRSPTAISWFWAAGLREKNGSEPAQPAAYAGVYHPATAGAA